MVGAGPALPQPRRRASIPPPICYVSGRDRTWQRAAGGRDGTGREPRDRQRLRRRQHPLPAGLAPSRIRLEIVPDAGGAFFQWFYFRLTGAAGRDCVLRIQNAGAATYPEGWKGYRAVASEDGEEWPRVATAYDGKVLTIRHRPRGDAVWFAYFAPIRWRATPRSSSAWRARPSSPTAVSAPRWTGRRSTCWSSARRGRSPAGSSAASTRARPWPSGGWRAFSTACWTPSTPRPARCWRRRASASCPT